MPKNQFEEADCSSSKENFPAKTVEVATSNNPGQNKEELWKKSDASNP